MKRNLFSAVVLLTATILITGCKQSEKKEQNQVINVKTITLSESSHLSALKFVGVVEAESKTNVSFKVQGEVDRKSVV